MKPFYCRYCRQTVPMFDEQEQAPLPKRVQAAVYI